VNSLAVLTQAGNLYMISISSTDHTVSLKLRHEHIVDFDVSPKLDHAGIVTITSLCQRTDDSLILRAQEYGIDEPWQGLVTEHTIHEFEPGERPSQIFTDDVTVFSISQDTGRIFLRILPDLRLAEQQVIGRYDSLVHLYKINQSHGHCPTAYFLQGGELYAGYNAQGRFPVHIAVS